MSLIAVPRVGREDWKLVTLDCGHHRLCLNDDFYQLVMLSCRECRWLRTIKRSHKLPQLL